MSLFHAILLGIIQGLTEFLPVSSSGHLVLTQQLLGIEGSNLTFDVAVHLGTLLAVVVALWDDIVTLFDGLRLGSNPRTLQGRKLISMIIIGTLPTIVIALAFKDQIEGLFTSIYTTGIMLIVTGTVIYLAERTRTGKRSVNDMRASDAFFVGCGQALAILPGLSRSGTTISAGFLRGLNRDSAARFSFLLSIPAILGAAVLELPDALESGSSICIAGLIAGMVSAAIVGYFAITLLVRLVRKRSLVVFSYYTWGVGALSLLLTYFRG